MSAPPELPPLVSAALSLSGRRGFVSSTRNETGRLLATLAASRTGTLGEVGTGCGVGSAWLRHGATKDTKIVTAESNPQLAQIVKELFADDGRIEVLSADWTALIERGPFSLLFVDAREAKLSARDVIAEAVEPGGFVVLDDFTPSGVWPPMYEGRVDTLRQEWLQDKRFTTVEVMVAIDAAVLLATRR
ncbi:O-methyltransferase [Kribbella sp. CA-293567]|uniref:O-methyltransferase n=1 Tax=Kribbella sp. CA-293567 TaxID=3002436 RepID=UPI0022DD7234|nr:class I SAM-dependent methyltransferase [Kribbella sp. CA-293567]WBQ07565.1 class I SAM-dependent methyltransferase [Kribbella sp. CA-293567]